MVLEQLSIINFKNIEDQNLSFCNGFNCFSGENGAGKTNTLDAIHFLSTCRSIASMRDRDMICHSAEFFMLEGKYVKRAVSSKVTCGCKRKEGKRFKLNDKEYTRLSDHIGEFPVVLVSPQDTAIINDAAEERRRYINLFLSQIDKEYIGALIGYNTILDERNTLLKNGQRGELLDVMDMQLCRYAEILHSKRIYFVEELLPIASKYYRFISGEKETLELRYKSSMNETSLQELLDGSKERDLMNGYTSVGPHRDDLVMSLDGYQVRRYGSQGQQKSFLIALKLAQSELILKHKGIRPLLLLDDIFDKLDFSRVENLASKVADGALGQIFITDSNKVRMDKVLQAIGCERKLFEVEGGSIKEI